MTVSVSRITAMCRLTR